ncbi:MAG: inovirus Gp2 family protein [Acidovorax sp.]|uniref:YagK/YfjJ domain-containing protein n=1 Tax=Acidovorax sp. TaxID=1872122 RepID=UPI0025C4740A|nr:inovirus-type Gp2 protein [Acidovorax sp.]MCE1194307.1 inovirus Gp2 family protein [Acidovorax sp.]
MSKVKKENGRNLESVTNYCRELQDTYSKLLAVRIDLGYKKAHGSECRLDEIKQDVKHLLDNRRGKRSLFEHQVGYVVKFEDTEEKGPHAHALFFYDGQKACKDAYLGDQIGNYWNERITDGNGVFHNCNKNRYDQRGIGMIDHSDFAKRAVLEEKVIGYMLKDEQSIDGIKQSGREKSLTKGVCTHNKSNAGRPRK